jgi:hypothetical protein
MKISPDQPSGLSALDRPNSYIGRSVPQPNLPPLTQGRGQYVTDVTLPRMPPTMATCLFEKINIWQVHSLG